MVLVIWKLKFEMPIFLFNIKRLHTFDDQVFSDSVANDFLVLSLVDWCGRDLLFWSDVYGLMLLYVLRSFVLLIFDLLTQMITWCVTHCCNFSIILNGATGAGRLNVLWSLCFLWSWWHQLENQTKGRLYFWFLCWPHVSLRVIILNNNICGRSE